MEYQELSNKAFAHFREGRFAKAAPVFETLIREHRHAVDFDYDPWLRALARCYEETGDPTSTGLIHGYLHDFDKARGAFQAAHSDLDLAFIEEMEGNPAEAARLFRQSDLHGLAASAQARHLGSEADAGLLILDHQRLLKSKDPEKHPRLHAVADIRLGRELLRAGLTEVARKVLQRARGRLGEWIETLAREGRTREAAFAWRMMTIAAILLGDHEAASAGYTRLAELLFEEGKPHVAMRFRETLAVDALNKGDLEGAIALYHHTLDRFSDRLPEVTTTLRWRLARTCGLAARQSAHPERAIELWSKAAHLIEGLGAAAELALCYREIAAHQLNPKTTDHFWDRARDVRDHIATERASEGIFPKTVDLLDWLDFTVTLLRLEDLKGNLGHLLREMIWNLDHHIAARREVLSIILDLIGRKQPLEDILLRIVKVLRGVDVDRSLSILDEVLKTPSESLHLALMEESGHLRGAAALKILSHGLNDPRMSVRCEAIEALEALDHPQALAGLRELYFGCGCVGGRRALLEAMARCQAPSEALIAALEGLPRDPSTEAAYQAALKAAQA